MELQKKDLVNMLCGIDALGLQYSWGSRHKPLPDIIYTHKLIDSYGGFAESANWRRSNVQELTEEEILTLYKELTDEHI